MPNILISASAGVTNRHRSRASTADETNGGSPQTTRLCISPAVCPISISTTTKPVASVLTGCAGGWTIWTRIALSCSPSKDDTSKTKNIGCRNNIALTPQLHVHGGCHSIHHAVFRFADRVRAGGSALVARALVIKRTVLACGPFSPACSVKLTLEPSFRLLNRLLMTLFAWK